jgi:hypothetical protein
VYEPQEAQPYQPPATFYTATSPVPHRPSARRSGVGYGKWLAAAGAVLVIGGLLLYVSFGARQATPPAVRPPVPAAGADAPASPVELRT